MNEKELMKQLNIVKHTKTYFTYKNHQYDRQEDAIAFARIDLKQEIEKNEKR